MAGLQEPKDADLEREDGPEDGPDDPAPKAEDIQIPADPNEPIAVPVEEPAASRREKRARRQNEFQRIQRENEEFRARLAEVERRSQYAAPPQQQHQQNPLVAEENAIYAEQRRLHEEFNAVASRPGFTPEQREHYERRAIDLERRKYALYARAAQPQIDINQLSAKIAWTQFENEHADVMLHDQNARQWAVAQYYTAMAEGKPDTRELAEEILDRARIRFGKQPRKLRGSTPDQATRQRLSGVAARGPGTASTEGVINMTKDEQRMARIAFSYLPPKQAYQKWANGPGRRLAKK